MSASDDTPASKLESCLLTLESINQSSFDNDGERGKALHAAYALVCRLESPWETICRLAMGQPCLNASLKVLKDLQLFERWYEHGDVAMKYDELAKLVSCDAMLIERLVRHLGANNLLEEVSPGKFKQTAFTLTLLKPIYGEWINFMYDAIIPGCYKMPEYLTQTGYSNPSNPDNGIFQYTKGSTGTLFDYQRAHAREAESFNQAMGAMQTNEASWVSVYPHETLVNSAANDAPILVDVGGGLGQDLERFRAHHPDLADRLYLQDLSDVVASSTCPDPVHKMAHDFFTPQPIQGARAYYLHHILHDWTDEPARQILEMLKPAMKPGYSTLLVHDYVLPESHVSPQATAYDLTLMVLVSALERTESMWRALFASAGFQIVKIWSSPLMTTCIIEVEPIDGANSSCDK